MRYLRQDAVPDDSRNIVMAQNMQISLKERLVRGMTAAVFYIDEENTILKMKKIITTVLCTILNLPPMGFGCGRLATLELVS